MFREFSPELNFIFICRFESIQLGTDNGIPTKPFLSSCSCIIPFLGKQEMLFALLSLSLLSLSLLLLYKRIVDS